MVQCAGRFNDLQEASSLVCDLPSGNLGLCCSDVRADTPSRIFEFATRTIEKILPLPSGVNDLKIRQSLADIELPIEVNVEEDTESQGHRLFTK